MVFFTFKELSNHFTKFIYSMKTYQIENIKSQYNDKREFDFFTFEYFTRDIEQLRQSHRHEFYALIYCNAGSGVHTIDFHDYILKPKRVFIMNIGQVHSWKAVRALKGYVVLFTEDFYNLIFTNNRNIRSDNALFLPKPFIDLNDNDSSQWESVLKMIEQEFISNKEQSAEIICLMLKTLVLKYNRAAGAKEVETGLADRKASLIQEYKKMINRHYKEWKLPKQYAESLFITPNYLNALSNSIIGKPASQLIRERVVLEAKRMLSHTDISITQLAFELGFEDKSHFGKYFKSTVNMTPEGFRQHFIKKTQSS